jgi:hypothetical protein
MNLLGKSFGISWSPAWLYIFSPVMYGSVVGFFTLIGVLFGLINQPMFNYCKDNDDFATMNFIQGKITQKILIKKQFSSRAWNNDSFAANCFEDAK